MRPLQVNGDHENAKKASSPSHLKINKGSYLIRKAPRSSLSSPPRSSLPSPSPSSQGTGASNMIGARRPPRHPVIIYTHSPKVIHTNPKDFMALVQKLTGLPRSGDSNVSIVPQPEVEKIEKNDNFKRSILDGSSLINKDNEPSSMIIDDNICYSQQFYDPQSATFDNMPFYNNMNNSNDLLGSTTPFHSYSNSLLLMPNMRSSLSSPTSGILQDYSEF